MFSLQQQKTYQNLLKAIPLALNAYLAEIGVETERDALFSVQKSKLLELYPVMRCLAYEVEFSYDAEIDLPEIYDKGAALFDLNSRLLNQIDLCKHFDSRYKGIDFSEMKTAVQLKKFRKFVHDLPDGKEKEIANFWLCTLSNICKETVIHGNKNIASDIYDEVESSSVSYEIAQKVDISLEDNERISLIDEVLFKSCKEALTNQKFPAPEILSKQIFNTLKDYDKNDYPSLPRLSFVVHNCMAPLNELIEDNQDIYTQAENDLKNMLAFDDDIQKNNKLTASQLREIIFQQHLENLKRPNMKRFDLHAFLQKSKPFNLKEFYEAEKNIIECQKQFLQTFAIINQEAPKWLVYEQRREISNMPLLNETRKDLIRLILNQLVAVKSDTKGNIEDLSALVKFASELQNIIDEETELNSKNLLHILSFTDALVSTADAANKYLGTSFDNQTVNHDILNMMHAQKEIYSYDLEFISDYVDKFAQTCNDFFKKKENQKNINISGFDKIKEKIANLPASMEKMEMLELINIYSHLIYGKFYNAAEEQKENTAEFFINFHSQEYDALKRKLAAMAEFYPEIQGEGIEKTAKRINASTVNDILLPLYQNQNPEKAYVTLYAGEQGLSDEAMSGLVKISGEFISSVIKKHYLLLKDGNISPNLVKKVIEQTSTNNLIGAFEESLRQSSKELQKQIDIYNRFQEFNLVRKKTTVSKELRQRLIIKYKYYN